MQAIVYSAKSTEDRKGSIQRQLRQCRSMAEREGWAVAYEDEDENESAYHGSRGEGLKRAIAKAEELAPCVLLVHHSDRLARGDAVQAKHLVEYALWALKAGVSIRSVEDDETFTDIATAASQGQRNTNDSRIKSTRTAEGLRESVEKGQWRGGIVPGGYEVLREHGTDDDGRPVTVCTVVKHAEDANIYNLIWRLAEAGKSVQAVSLECSRRGYRTRPRRRAHKSKSFDVNRVSQVLCNPFYAGLQAWGDGDDRYPGKWPTYVDVEVFDRLKAERERRGGSTKRPRGKPPKSYLLAQLATCSACGGGLRAVTGKPRKDGTQRYQYICGNHRDHNRSAEEWCPAPPWDAVAADRKALAGLDHLLADADALRSQLQAGRRAERTKLEDEVTRALADAKKADRAAELATTEFAGAADDAERALLKDAATLMREKADKARELLDSAQGALEFLSGEDEPDPEAALAAVWEALSGRIADAQADVQLINAALREAFEAVVLHADGHVEARVRASELWDRAREAAGKPPYKLWAPATIVITDEPLAAVQAVELPV